MIYTSITALCFLYTGSVYMSQLYRLLDYFSYNTVDMITSTINYLFQGLGMGIYIYLLRKNNPLVKQKKTFIISLIVGIVFMILMQLSNNGNVILLAGIVFNALIGFYTAFYLTFTAANIETNRLGLSYGTAYAIGTVGTYVISLLGDGDFLVSEEITVIYLILVSLTIALVFYSDNLICESKEDVKEFHTEYLTAILVIMSLISTVGSCLYLSLPTNDSVNFTLIRAFYAVGLIIAGYIIDKNREIGNIVTLASLVYPLIGTVVSANSKLTTVTLSLSYAMIGFFAVYRTVTFMSFGSEDNSYLYLSSVGLMISRIVEALVTIPIIYCDISSISQLIVSSLLFAILIVIYFLYQSKLNTKNITAEKRFNIVSDKYKLSLRETEILQCLYDGMSDKEISNKFYISTNTVRFHISNIMKKTKTTSRVEIVRLVKNI